MVITLEILLEVQYSVICNSKRLERLVVTYQNWDYLQWKN